MSKRLEVSGGGGLGWPTVWPHILVTVPCPAVGHHEDHQVMTYEQMMKKKKESYVTTGYGIYVGCPRPCRLKPDSRILDDEILRFGGHAQKVVRGDIQAWIRAKVPFVRRIYIAIVKAMQEQRGPCGGMKRCNGA